MNQRDARLQSFIDATSMALGEIAWQSSAPRHAAARIFAALEIPQNTTATERRADDRPRVCSHLGAAYRAAGDHGGQIERLAKAFAAIEPELTWRPRAGAEKVGRAFSEGHANAEIIGPAGIEVRGDVRIGASLMAPEITYPDHTHPPEEVYVALTDGEWRQNDLPWHRPGIGGGVYNPPGIVHAMRSGPAPFLAIWCLWVG